MNTDATKQVRSMMTPQQRQLLDRQLADNSLSREMLEIIEELRARDFLDKNKPQPKDNKCQ